MKRISKLMLAAVASVALAAPAFAWDFSASGSAAAYFNSTSTTPITGGTAVAPVAEVVLVELNVADDDPLAEKSQASAGAASATEATAASIIFNCFITLLKLL